MEDLQAIHELLTEAVAHGARRKPACELLGVSVRTWQRADNTVDGRQHMCCRPHNKLSNVEQETILAVINRPEYASLAPSQIVPKLADTGEYLASESTLYRLFATRMLQWPLAVIKWRALCAERCTYGSERRGREIVRLRSASYSTTDNDTWRFLLFVSISGHL